MSFLTKRIQVVLYSSVLCLSTFVLVAVRGSTQGCPDHVTSYAGGYKAVHDHTCYLFVNREVYWSTARDDCWDLGGELLAIEDERTQHFIINTLNSDELGWSREGVWLGGRHRSGAWRWTNGQEITYKNWASGQPSAGNLLSFLQDCMLMRSDDNWQWHDQVCGSLKFHYNYICQFRTVDISMSRTSTVPNPTQSKPNVEPTSIPGPVHEAASASETTEPASGWSELLPVILNKSHPDSDYYQNLGKKVYQLVNHERSHPEGQLHARTLSDTALSKPGDKPGTMASSATSQAEDNGYTNILTIIIATSAGFLLILLLIFLFVFRHHRNVRRRKEAETAVRFQNTGYDAENSTPPPRPHRIPPALPATPAPSLPDDTYLTPSDVFDSYAQVNKPRNNHLHMMNFTPKTCDCRDPLSAANNSGCSSMGSYPELGACGGSDHDSMTPLMPNVLQKSKPKQVTGGKCMNCTSNQADYIDMNSMSSKDDLNGIHNINSLKELSKEKCPKDVGKDKDSHTYSNVDHRETAVENHYEVLP